MSLKVFSSLLVFAAIACFSQIEKNAVISEDKSISVNTKSEVWISSSDGFRLRGEFYPAKSEGAGVLMLHQCNRKDKLSGYEQLAEKLNNRGLHVLILDFRSYGGSVNEKFSPQHRRDNAPFNYFPADTEAAYQFLISQKNVLKRSIGVIGASCGGDQAIILAKKHAEVKAFVFLSAWLEEDFLPLARLPVFLISSENDTFEGVLPSLQKVFRQTNHKSSKLLIYKGQEHGTPLFDQDENMETMIADWMKSILNRNE